MSYGLKTDYANIDNELALIARNQKIYYLSPRSILCNEQGCLVLVGEKQKKYIVFDTTHLTLAGSQYLTSKFELK